MDYTRTIVMACATVMEEMLPLIPPGMQHQVFDFGLHINPEKLHNKLQEAIDTVSGQYDTILLGYGLCSQAIVSIKANGCRLVAPRVDDCIAIFLGSRSVYTQQSQQEPGTYYLSKGWIEVGDSPFSEFERSVQRYGKETAEYIYQMMMGNYQRLALINSGQNELEKYRVYAQRTAKKFSLRFEEIAGSDRMIKKMFSGDWDDDFVVIEPGQSFTLADFIDPTKNENT